jgi:hypothetical protein
VVSTKLATLAAGATQPATMADCDVTNAQQHEYL